MSLDFEQRCAIAAACLPKADYRTQLEKLHAEMLAALEAAHQELAEIHQGLTNPGWFTNGPKAAYMHALNWSRKSAERRTAMKDAT
jgi:hypothetical protein